MKDAPLIDNLEGNLYVDTLLNVRSMALLAATIGYAGNNMRIGTILTAAEEFEKWLLREEPT